ncbi:MAG: divalent-cation tolerance protein CutA [Candidatus Diapherotrites archaeon]|uniref:Divalent-cation tolerance protein CutA n=1 Tax=Candidatus Iainarchaeum sp. TaxID=3101447 RepID=A0A2D6LNU2_9ARCH|nr:divalent-cation tolerance protein CutA [Candidatus Diapherotrites archaeon]|tara:strand:+ start:16799 stop:17101 length:303 start_codon:yes stop_codon:yes gene_type:complete
MILLYITSSSKEEAEKISNTLLDEKLIACANIIESKSIYNWKGKRENSKEFIIFAKTSEEKINAAEKKVKELHSYEIPCIIKFPINANSEYSEWINSELV